MMNQPFYTIDQGNSNSSIFYWSNNSGRKVSGLEQKNVPAYISSVSRREGLNHPGLREIKFTQGDYFGKMKVNYGETPGVDRLLFAYWGFRSFPDKNLLLIDSGTYLTIDLLTPRGFEGGVIYPGHELFNSTYKSGSNLHVPKYSKVEAAYPFKNTKNTLEQAYYLMVKSTVLEILRTNEINQIVTSGGHGMKIYQLLKADFEVLHLENAVHHGIYTYVNDLT